MDNLGENSMEFLLEFLLFILWLYYYNCVNYLEYYVMILFNKFLGKCWKRLLDLKWYISLYPNWKLFKHWFKHVYILRSKLIVLCHKFIIDKNCQAVIILCIHIINIIIKFKKNLSTKRLIMLNYVLLELLKTFI